MAQPVTEEEAATLILGGMKKGGMVYHQSGALYRNEPKPVTDAQSASSNTQKLHI